MNGCPHDRPSPAVCFDCDVDERSESDTAGPEIVAPHAIVSARRDGGTCPGCDQPIREGHRIGLYGDGHARHVRCDPSLAL